MRRLSIKYSDLIFCEYVCVDTGRPNPLDGLFYVISVRYALVRVVRRKEDLYE